MAINKFYGMLGLAKRAGKVISGESGCKEAIRFLKAYLVIIAEDTGKNTFKNITDSCKFYNVPFFVIGTMETLGRAIGNSFNAVAAITDEGLAKSIEKCINANINGGE